MVYVALQVLLCPLSLTKGDALSHIQELLELYNLPQLKENHLIINAIQSVSFELKQKMVDAKPFPLFIRGLKVNLGIDSKVFRGHSLYIFSQLLSHVFNPVSYTHLRAHET